MNETATADPERSKGAAAPAKLRAASDDVSSVRPRRDVEHEAGNDEKPEIVDTEHSHCPESQRNPTLLIAPQLEARHPFFHPVQTERRTAPWNSSPWKWLRERLRTLDSRPTWSRRPIYRALAWPSPPV